MQKVNAEIIRFARELRLVTQEDLAKNIGVEQGTLSKMEKDILVSEPEIVERIASSLNLPISFFYQERKINPVEGHYRRKVSTSVKKMKQYVAQMTVMEWHLMALLDEIELPETNMPKWDVLIDGEPKLCAKHIRDLWRLPKGRISNLTKVIEDNGIVIIAIDLGELDGFSTYFNGNIPVIFINKNMPPDRYRLTVAHELGHLIMHFGFKIDSNRDLESEAYEFGIELLVPENNIRPYFAKVSIEKLADLKAYWYVSMAALLKYANTLGMVNGNQYRYLWTQMGAAGYRTKEPVLIPNETPGIVNEIINAYLIDLGYTKDEMAKILHLTVPEFEKIYIPSKVKLKAI
ncbi:MAG TPA: XRE family transcriptional regulator [Flavisolibacter sp.]|nr:XRE family transcriptional regulator [Flavisolibacter sp.]